MLLPRVSSRKLITGALVGAIVFAAWPLATSARSSPTSLAGPVSMQAQPQGELHFAYAGGQAGRDAIEQAVDEAIADMNVLIRGIARKRLLEANAVIEHFAFALEGDPVVASYVGGRIIAAPRSGKSITWTDQYGEKIQVSHHYADGKLVQKMVGSKGRRTNIYRFSDDEQTMSMSVEIVAAQLPAAVRYRVTYRRAS